MTCFHDGPTLEELLGDSVTRAVMKADGVDPTKLEIMLRAMAREIAGDSARRATLLDESTGSLTATLQDQASCWFSGSRIRSQRRVAS
jgi:hypothetical protein